VPSSERAPARGIIRPMSLARSGRPLPLPPARLRFMGEDDETLIRVGDELAGLLVSQGLTAGSSVLDVGCGYGRLALGILHSTDHRGPYLGFDILPRQIEWCRTTISPAFPSVRFVHLDVRNGRYNPKGTIEATDVAFPARSATTDVCALFSVFTHLYRADIERYLGEIRRVLRPGGVAVTTWFLLDEARVPLAAAPTAMYPMVHVLDATTRYAEATDPLRAIAYDEAAVRAMVVAARLELVSVERGTWAGEPGRTVQDLVVLRRSATDTTIDPQPKGPAIPARGHPAIAWLRRLPRRVARRVRRLVAPG
jgi:SAM-dependent methyltransferase